MSTCVCESVPMSVSFSVSVSVSFFEFVCLHAHVRACGQALCGGAGRRAGGRAFFPVFVRPATLATSDLRRESTRHANMTCVSCVTCSGTGHLSLSTGCPTGSVRHNWNPWIDHGGQRLGASSLLWQYFRSESAADISSFCCVLVNSLETLWPYMDI